jgi:hypothetical protein
VQAECLAAIAPVQRRLPALGLHHGPAVGQPQRGAPVAAVVDEGLPFTVGHEAARQRKRCQVHDVARALVVETKAGVGVVADLDLTARRFPPIRVGHR